MKVAGIRKFSSAALLAAVTCAVMVGENWPTQSGSPERDGWARAEKTFTKENAGGLQLLYKYKADNKSRGADALTSPLIDGMLITYLGFKEMLVFGGSSDNVYSVDADLNRLIWKRHLEYKADKPQSENVTQACPGGLSAAVMMPGSSSGVRSFTRRIRRARTNNETGGISELLASGFGRLGAFFAVGSDGYLHILNTSTGADLIPPIKFVPPNSRVSSLNFNENVVYAATLDGCGGNPNALYALDLAAEDHKVTSLTTNGSGLAGLAGTAIGTDGTVYAQIRYGRGDEAGAYHDTVVALGPKDLKVKDYFTPAGTAAESDKNTEATGVTPLVFSSKGKDLIVAGGSGGRVYLLDSTSLGGADHHKPLSETGPIANADTNHAGYGFRGTFSSWEDADSGTRWVYASMAGPPNASAGFTTTNGSARTGSVVALKMDEKNSEPKLAPTWISRSLVLPAPVVTTNGLVFALSSGKPAGAHATLYALDGATGKELYSSGDAVDSYSHNSGLAVANGRIYFTTHDNAVYCFGFRKMQPQLTER